MRAPAASSAPLAVLAAAVVVLGACGGLFACAPRAGWQREEARACAPGSPPIVCMQAEPDRPIELRFSRLSLLPGECARAPAGAHGGSLAAELADRHGATERVRVPVRRDRITFVRFDAKGRSKVTSRERCDRRVPDRLADGSAHEVGGEP